MAALSLPEPAQQSAHQIIECIRGQATWNMAWELIKLSLWEGSETSSGGHPQINCILIGLQVVVVATGNPRI